MRDDDLRRLLRDRNPWWAVAARGGDPTGWVASDAMLRQAARSRIDYQPSLVEGLRAPELVVVRGPRRVGKSVMAKRLIAQWCGDATIGPGRVIYAALDGMAARDVRRIFTLGRALAPGGRDDAPLYWVLDEVSSVKDWAPVVKEMRDNTPLADDALLITGSSAADLASARKALGPGRTHSADPFRVLLPMSFREYVHVAGLAVADVPHCGPHELMGAEAADAFRRLDPWVGELDLAWQAYLECGGFPRAVSESLAGGVSPSFVRDVHTWIVDDVDVGDGPDATTELLELLTARQTSPLNVATLSREVGMSRSSMTIRLNRLVGAFGGHWCHQRDDRGKRVPSSQSKLYLSDPILSWLPHLMGTSRYQPEHSTLTEQQLALTMARAVDALAPGRFVEAGTLGYRRTGSGRKVDFAAMPVRVHGEWLDTVPVEAKWVSSGHRGVARVLTGVYGRGILATKEVVDIPDDNDPSCVWAVPAPVVALVLAAPR